MNLYESIWQRKSCRKYDMTPLPEETLGEVTNAIEGFQKLSSNAAFEYRFFKDAKGRFLAEAPHYLMISGKGAPYEQEHVGFLYEQLILWFDAHDIGSVWLGSTLDAQNAGKHDMIAIAFGNTIESPHRARTEFNRKDIETITNAPDDTRIQAVHIAPSGMNTQPWYFEKTEAGVLVYRRKLKPPISLAYKLTSIDMGIALCHYALACEHEGAAFNFTITNDLPKKRGHVPLGIIKP